MRTVLSSGSDQPDLLGDLLAPISRVRVVAEIAMVLGVPETVAGEVVEASTRSSRVRSRRTSKS